MAETATTSPLAEADNGHVTPLFFDRQVLNAADLSIGHTSRDAELARMRRLMHGWGVVVGLVPEVSNGRLRVSPGYAVTPTGEEVYLPSEITVDEIGQLVNLCCGPDAESCETIDPNPDREVPNEIIAWLIARPTETPSALRSGVAEGCSHPANTLSPSRVCGGVELDLICSLPETHVPPAKPMDTLTRIVCGLQGADGDPTAGLLPMPEMPGPEANFVVLGLLALTPNGIQFRTDGRRALLPVSTLQAWICTQTCNLLYYVNRNAQSTGEHEVHVLDCPTPANEENRVYLGNFQTCAEAVIAARAVFENVDGCANCLPDCHTR